MYLSPHWVIAYPQTAKILYLLCNIVKHIDPHDRLDAGDYAEADEMIQAARLHLLAKSLTFGEGFPSEEELADISAAANAAVSTADDRKKIEALVKGLEREEEDYFREFRANPEANA